MAKREERDPQVAQDTIVALRVMAHAICFSAERIQEAALALEEALTKLDRHVADQPLRRRATGRAKSKEVA